MNEPSSSFKWISALWAILIGVGIIALAGSVLLPSTKRSRIDWDEVRRLQAEEDAAATTAPSSAPTEDATTRPSPL